MSWIHDGSAGSPRLRIDLCLGNLADLPEWSRGPRADDPDRLVAVREAGFEGVQAGPELAGPARDAGLALTLAGRVDEPGDANRLASIAKDCGADAVTLHVGSGFDDEAGADRLLEAVVEASRSSGVPLFVETHRATLTQDPYRTLRLAERHPDLRFNADLSHWYTGAEMVYGDWEAKLSYLEPFFGRCGFLHGRIASPGCIQMPANVRNGQEPAYVVHFRELWRRVFSGFLSNSGPGDVIVFAPELLSPRNSYARTFDGREETDRWEQALLIAEIARDCFAKAADAKL